MNLEIKTKWLAALRSGEYSQTRANLRDSEGFCCLGVLCDIYSKENEVSWGPPKKPYYSHLTMGGMMSLPPEAVVEWSGLDRRSPIIDEAINRTGFMSELTVLNDDGMPFSQIADLIEAFL
jgi:hypothetical protein